jgi:hypothetical protein
MKTIFQFASKIMPTFAATIIAALPRQSAIYQGNVQANLL